MASPRWSLCWHLIRKKILLWNLLKRVTTTEPVSQLQRQTDNTSWYNSLCKKLFFPKSHSTSKRISYFKPYSKARRIKLRKGFIWQVHCHMSVQVFYFGPHSERRCAGTQVNSVWVNTPGYPFTSFLLVSTENNPFPTFQLNFLLSVH